MVSPDLNLLFRLLNAPALRARFEQGDFALIVSDDVYERVIEWDIAMIERRDFTPLPVELTNPGRPGPNGKDEKPVRVAYASLPPQPDPGPIDRSAHHEGPDVHAQLEQLVQRMQDLLDDDPPS